MMAKSDEQYIHQRQRLLERMNTLKQSMHLHQGKINEYKNQLLWHQSAMLTSEQIDRLKQLIEASIQKRDHYLEQIKTGNQLLDQLLQKSLEEVTLEAWLTTPSSGEKTSIDTSASSHQDVFADWRNRLKTIKGTGDKIVEADEMVEAIEKRSPPF